MPTNALTWLVVRARLGKVNPTYEPRTQLGKQIHYPTAKAPMARGTRIARQSYPRGRIAGTSNRRLTIRAPWKR
jgi:hypothetical protein